MALLTLAKMCRLWTSAGVSDVDTGAWITGISCTLFVNVFGFVFQLLISLFYKRLIK